MAAQPHRATGFAGHPRGSPAYRRLLAALFLAGVATFAQLYSPQAVLPAIARAFGVGTASSALVISASTIGLAAGVIPWSALSDRIGRVRAMVIAVTTATALGLIAPFAPTFPLLLTGRLLEGLMIGGVPAIAIAYLTEEVDARHAARAAGTYVAGTTLGGLFGRIVAGPVAELAGWRIGVFSVAAVCAVAAGLFIWWVPASRGFVPARLRADAARPSAGSDAAPSLSGRLLVNLRSGRLLALYAQGFLLMGGFVALYNFLAFRLEQPPFSVPSALISLIFVAYLAGTWSSAQAGALASRIGRLPVLLTSIGVMAGGVALTVSGVLMVVLLGLLLTTAGFFGAHSVASGWTGSAAKIGKAQASSLYNLFYYAGSSVFGWFGGVVFSAGGWGALAASIGALALIAALIAAAALRRPRSPSVQRRD